MALVDPPTLGSFFVSRIIYFLKKLHLNLLKMYFDSKYTFYCLLLKRIYFNIFVSINAPSVAGVE